MRLPSQCLLQQASMNYAKGRTTDVPSLENYGHVSHDIHILVTLVQDDDSNTALIKACQKGYVKTAMLLLDYDADVGYQNKVRTIDHKCYNVMTLCKRLVLYYSLANQLFTVQVLLARQSVWKCY